MKYKCITDGFIFTVKEGSQFQELLASDKEYELLVEKEDSKEHTVTEIKELLSEKGIEYPKNAKKEELLRLLSEVSNEQNRTSEDFDKGQED